MGTRWLAMSVAVLIAPLSARAAEPLKLALVIGNGSYQALPPLPSCLSSARVVAATLQRAGFTVREQTNESNGRLGTAISDFADALAAAPGAAAVLYFCGYAVGFNGRVFLLPTPATLERSTDALTQGVVGRLPVQAVTGAPVRAGLILLDTVAPPGATAPTPFATLLDGTGLDSTGVVAVQSVGSAPQGSTTLAVALSAAFAQQPVELKATVQTLRNAFVGQPSTTLVVHEPPSPRLLAGEAAPVQAATPTPTPSQPSPSQPVASSMPVPFSTPVPAQATIAAPWSPGPGELRRGQLALQRLGYFRGMIDGVAGPIMLAAIKRYQTENKQEPTGLLTEDEFAQLLQVGR